MQDPVPAEPNAEGLAYQVPFLAWDVQLALLDRGIKLR
jgi:hypothetical protein